MDVTIVGGQQYKLHCLLPYMRVQTHGVYCCSTDSLPCRVHHLGKEPVEQSNRCNETDDFLVLRYSHPASYDDDVVRVVL